MDPNTGHLVALNKLALNELDAADEGRSLEEVLKAGYEEIPQELAAEAEAALGERSETYVDLSVPSPLSQFAADHRRRKARKKARNRRLRKAAKKRA